MAEKPEEEFDEEESDDSASGGEDLDLDQLMREIDPRKRRGHKPAGDPAWRKLERYLEDKRTHDLLLDFDEYEVGQAREDPPSRPEKKPAEAPRRKAVPARRKARR